MLPLVPLCVRNCNPRRSGRRDSIVIHNGSMQRDSGRGSVSRLEQSTLPELFLRGKLVFFIFGSGEGVSWNSEHYLRKVSQ